MIIKPSAVIRQNYSEVSALCKKTQEPVYLTKNGEGDLVVMDLEAFERRRKMLNLWEELINVQAERLAGAPDYELSDILEDFEAVRKELEGRANI